MEVKVELEDKTYLFDVNLNFCLEFSTGRLCQEEPEKPGDCWDMQGMVMSCSRAGDLCGRIGVIPGEGVAISLVHSMVIISVRLLKKLTVLCALILFERKYKNICSRSSINVLGVTVYFN